MKVFKTLGRKGKLAITGAVLAIVMTAIGTFAVTPAKAFAAACDDVNIVNCGIEGTSAESYIKNFQALYVKNSDNGHNDLQTVYNWAGLSDANVANMDTSNTKVGTLYRNGEVKVDGEVVANDAWASARFTNGDGFVKVTDGVWARKTTTSFENASVKVLVHYVGDGTVDSVIMINCGNAVKVTPVAKPKPVLKCVNLKATATTVKNNYTFTAQGSATNTKIVSYTFDFGDGKTATVTTAGTTATITHVFAEDGKTYKAVVSVTGVDGQPVSGTACAVSITTTKAPEECKPGIPKGDARCTECKPGIPAGDERCEAAPVVEEQPEELVNAGPGAVVGLFAGTSAIGALGHRYIRRRHNRD